MMIFELQVLNMKTRPFFNRNEEMRRPKSQFLMVIRTSSPNLYRQNAYKDTKI